MKTLVFASQKGGSGKTTLAAHIAVAAERAKRGPVVLMDADPQGSLASWWNRREASSPAFAALLVRDIRDRLATLASAGTALCVIDTPPAVTEINRAVISAADLVVIPSRASPHDLAALGSTIDLCHDAGVPFVFALNSAKPSATITAQAVELLATQGDVAPLIGDRIVFASAMTDGRTAMEIDSNSKASREVAAVLRFVLSRFNPPGRKSAKTSKE